MANIRVHILNFHNITNSHMEILLENTSTEPSQYYVINRWDEYPSRSWWCAEGERPKILDRASSTYSFEKELNPREVVDSWLIYFSKTRLSAHVLGENCAVAAQWFLTEFAGIPEPSLSNVSANHLALGIMWPSFIPCPVTLPGRVMSNAKFHMEAQNNPETAEHFSKLFLCTSLSTAMLAFGASVFALAVAATVLTGGLAAVAIAGCTAAALVSSYGFFKAYNKLSAKSMVAEMKKYDDDDALLESTTELKSDYSDSEYDSDDSESGPSLSFYPVTL